MIVISLFSTLYLKPSYKPVTVTVHEADAGSSCPLFLPTLVAVTIAVPAPVAVTVPSSLTFTTFSSLVVQISSLFVGDPPYPTDSFSDSPSSSFFVLARVSLVGYVSSAASSLT